MGQLWTCIACGFEMESQLPAEREGSTCDSCNSTWRNRATILAISECLGYGSLPLPEWPENWAVRGVGFDDSPVLFTRLPQKTLYTNTHLDKFPTLNLTDVPDHYSSALNYIVCGDVLEHIGPGELDLAISGIKKLLVGNGFAVISVPLVVDDDACELYPGASDIVIVSSNHVRWRKGSGEWIDDYDPEFHGGTGQVLAFRRFSQQMLIESFQRNGLNSISHSPKNEHVGVPLIENAGIFVVWN